jgi:cytoskeleton protein RodZ
MDSTGEILRRARNERHLTLDEVAIRTRINRKYLAAIETGDTSAIPGGFFYKSFVRQYAAALSTGDDNLLDRVEQSLAAEQPPGPPPPDEEVLKALATKAEENGASGSSDSRSAAAYAVLLLLAVAGTTGVYMVWHRAQQAPSAGEVARATPHVPNKEDVSPSPQPTSAQPGSPQPAAPQQQAPSPEAQAPVPPVPAEPESSAPATAAQVPPSSVPVPVPEEGVSAKPEPNSEASADNKIAINLSAKVETWVSVSADGKTLFRGTLAAGESKTFAAKENARMRIGNAGGLDVGFNGTPTGSLGSNGQPVTVLFTPSSFEIVKPKPPDEPPQED